MASSTLTADVAWKGTPLDYDALPGTLAQWLAETSLSGAELTAIRGDDSNSVNVDNVGPPAFDSGGILVRFDASALSGGRSQLDWSFRTYDDGAEQVSLWVYNFNLDGGSFETPAADTDQAGPPPDTVTLTETKSVSLSDYEDGSGYIYGLVANITNTGTSCELQYPTVTVTYSPGTIDETGLGTDVDVETGIETELFSAAEDVGTVVLVATGWLTLKHTMPGLGTDVLAVTGFGVEHQAYSETGLGTSVLAVTGVSDQIGEAQGTTVLVVTGITTELATWVENVGTTVLVIAGGTAALTAAMTEDVGTTVLVETYVYDAKGLEEHRGTEVLVIVGVTDTQLYNERGIGTTVLVVTGKREHQYETGLGTDVLVETGLVRELVRLPLYLSVPRSSRRHLSWDGPLLAAGSLFALAADGKIIYGPTTERGYTLSREFIAREFLQVVSFPSTNTVAEIEAMLDTPLDKVDASWTDVSADSYEVRRKLGAGAYALIETLRDTELEDGPLDDGSYTYQVRALDVAGNMGVSVGSTEAVQAPPDPPSNLTASFDTGIGRLTLAWDASPSADVVSGGTYRVRSSGGEDRLLLTSSPVQDSAALTYTQDFTNETGTYIYSVTAVDSSGNEERNIRQVVIVTFSAGLASATPADPLFVRATPGVGATVDLTWSYFPSAERGTGAPGAATEGRVYYDNGTGIIDYTTPLATLAMSNPTAAAEYSKTVGPLTEGTEYRFVVRIATGVWPLGVETANTDAHTATPDATAPATPLLTTEIV